MKSEVGKCLALFRERQRRGGNGTGPSSSASREPGRWDASVRDIVLLGRLAYSWETIAGRDLRRFVYPIRLVRGRLVVLCADSQWMQTLTYLKPQIQANLQRLFPDARITRIQGEVGVIPAVLRESPTIVWPDWKTQPQTDLPDIGNPELIHKIQECRQKLRARLEGLRQQGYHLCRVCGSNLVPHALDTCSICQCRAREQDLAAARRLLYETPWLTQEEVRQQVPGLQPLEFDALRSDMAGEALAQVRALGRSLQESFQGGVWLKMRYEMLRAVIFQTGLHPHLIDLDEPTGRFLLDPAWKEFLALDAGEPAC